MTMRLGHIELFVRAPLEARRFYEDILGFAVTVIQGDSVVWLERDGLELLLRAGRTAPAPASYQDAAAALVLYTSNLDEAANHLRAHGVPLRGTDGSERCLTFTDPDGNWFQLVNPEEH